MQSSLGTCRAREKVLELVAVRAKHVQLGCSMTGSTEKTQAGDPSLDDVNACFARYYVVMFLGDDSKYRIWGDINRIQDIVDGPCRELFPDGARTDLDDFFATEVDTRVAACMRDAGVDAVIDPETGPGLELKGPAPSEDVMDRCFSQTYTYFSVPPEER